ncbi:MAG: class I SAM-dependent methyltransferase [Woeseiaceae bacterium]
MKKLKSGVLALAIALIFGACSKEEEPTTPAPASDESPPAEQRPAETPASDDMPADLRSALADELRPAEDRARDASRKPAEVVEFLGIEPGMKVLDVIAAGGYYTEVLSIAVSPEGQVVAQNPDAALEYNDGANEKAISARLAGNRLPNVTRLNKNFDEMSAADGPFDAAITALNFHDVYNGYGQEATTAFLQAIYAVLKPGGVFGITDHVGIAGADNEALHRIEKAKVIEAVVAAGFEADGESDVLANAADDHTQQVFSDAIRGKTDRFVLRFRKPAQ